MRVSRPPDRSNNLSKRALDLPRLGNILERFEKARLLVVGDVVLDEYLKGDVERVSPEAPVPVVHVYEESIVLGGAGNVVRNIAALGGGCAFGTVVGDDEDGRRVKILLEELGVDRRGVVVAPGRPTTRKTRVIAQTQQVVRYDRETVEGLPKEVEHALVTRVAELSGGADGAILEDYGKGLFTESVATALMQHLRDAGVPAYVDPKSEFARFRGAALLKPNLREAEAFARLRVNGADDLQQVAQRMRSEVGPADIVITRGGEGMTVFEGEQPGLHVPTTTREVFDPQGAGDTTIAALALALRAGASLLEAAVIANAAACVVAGKVGTATATPGEVLEMLPAAVNAAEAG